MRSCSGHFVSMGWYGLTVLSPPNPRNPPPPLEDDDDADTDALLPPEVVPELEPEVALAEFDDWVEDESPPKRLLRNPPSVEVAVSEAPEPEAAAVEYDEDVSQGQSKALTHVNNNTYTTTILRCILFTERGKKKEVQRGRAGRAQSVVMMHGIIRCAISQRASKNRRTV